MKRMKALCAVAVVGLPMLTVSTFIADTHARPSDTAGRDPELASSGIPFTRRLAPDHAVGNVVELLPAGSYQYARLIEPTGASLWVASLRSELELGPADVTVFGWREDFVSRRLDRTFDRLAFGLVRNAPGPRRP